MSRYRLWLDETHKQLERLDHAMEIDDMPNILDACMQIRAILKKIEDTVARYYENCYESLTQET